LKNRESSLGQLKKFKNLNPLGLKRSHSATI
jgi:hypothetical protein